MKVIKFIPAVSSSACISFEIEPLDYAQCVGEGVIGQILRNI